MTSPNDSSEQSKKLQKLWSDGVDLASHFSSLKAATPVEPSQFDSSTYQALNETALGRVSLSLDRSNRDKWRDDKLTEQLRRDLVGERLICIGRRSDDGRFWLELVASEFWLGARIQASSGRANDASVAFDMLRIVSNPLGASSNEVVPENEPVEIDTGGGEIIRRRGRPSQRDKIMAAIESCANVQNWFVANTPTARHIAYRRFIKATYGVDTAKVDGFDPKTFEKYETEYRNKSGV